MSFDWTEYLTLAELIHGQVGKMQVSEEALCRCAVSRAYYAAYCYSRNIAIDYLHYEVPDRRKEHKIHKNLIDFYKDQTALPVVASKLMRLKEWRENCDYDDVMPHGKNIRTMPSGAFRYSRETIDLLQDRYESSEDSSKHWT